MNWSGACGTLHRKSYIRKAKLINNVFYIHTFLSGTLTIIQKHEVVKDSSSSAFSCSYVFDMFHNELQAIFLFFIFFLSFLIRLGQPVGRRTLPLHRPSKCHKFYPTEILDEKKKSRQKVPKFW